MFLFKGGMEKKSLSLLLLALVMVSIFASVAMISAQTPADDLTGSPGNYFIGQFKNFFNVFSGQGDIGALGQSVKLLLLIIVVALIYSSMGAVKFPENRFIRFLLSAVVGLLATVLISTDEILTSLQSYSALGMTITLFFPILILTFFTFVVATKVNPFGILAQRLIWIIYSAYLFFKTGSFLLLKWLVGTPGKPIKFLGITAGTSAGGLRDIAADSFTARLFEFLYGSAWRDISGGPGQDTFVLLTLFIVSIAVFVIFVMYNRAFALWLGDEARKADLDKFQDTQTRAHGAREIEADATRS